MRKWNVIFLIFFVFMLIIIVSCNNINNDRVEENKVAENKIEVTEIEQTNEELIRKEKDFIFPNSHIEKLTEKQLLGLSNKLLEYARNEIFARKGHIFKKEKYRNYFAKKSWYKPTTTVEFSSLNSIEKYNVNFIKFFEDRYRKTHEKHENYKTNYDVYPCNKEINIDINGDGKTERILFELENMSNYKLHINNLVIEGELGNYSNNFAIVDIDKNDNFKEIIISDYGPSNDYVSYFYCYDGQNIIKMGQTEGLFEYGIKIDGMGKLSARTRSKILQTWFFDKYYTLSKEHKLIEVPQDIYITNYDVFIKRPIKLLKNRGNSDDYFILNEGRKVTIVGTDDKEWCLVETKTGERGWFAVDEFLIIRNEGLDAYKIFGGLCYAD
ncbi:YARHG domain-containing protein [Caloranaerobacter azorensis]|uniref:YARHG domain-containing protein n=1 Tax=Caloranaerobacter azorensis TaxID=116090 RepID=UPI000689ECB4|nr:YARHG domain-containing protein [Caloranaerobacter azorensis]